MKDTKQINGVLSATVGNDWIKLEFENHDITIEQLKVYNPYAQEVRRLQGIEQAIQEYSGDNTYDGLLAWLESTTGYKGESSC